MNKKTKTVRFRIQRRLGVELPGLGKPGALERRPYPPGERSANKRKKYSDYALRLEEKQKFRCHYCLKEHQLRRFIRNAKTGQSSNWINKLAGLLERRLDNVIFRLGWAPSIPSARQLVSHGHVQVNGKKVNIPSFVLKPGQEVTLKTNSEKNQIVLTAIQNPRMETPDFLKKEEKEGKMVGTMLAIPGTEYIPFSCDTGLLTEYYAARKV
ncbi:MAG: 30S ribosomal protein S4 [Bdellovibrionales bacterium]|nr:30S ribosomal protein S4 [Bdellovibrionales bacterium]